MATNKATVADKQNQEGDVGLGVAGGDGKPLQPAQPPVANPARNPDSRPKARFKAGQMEIAKIVVGKRFRKDATDGLQTLMASIRQRGLLQPIVVTADGNLVAGARRLEACKRLGFTTIPVRIVTNLTEGQKVAAECDENEERKGYTDDEALRILRTVYGEEKAKAKLRQRHHGHTAPGRKADTSVTTEEVKGEALGVAAKKAGVSKAKARRLLAGTAAVKDPAPKPRATGERAILARLKRFEKAAVKLLEDLEWVMKEMFGASKTRIPPRYYKKLGQTFQRLATDSTRLRKPPK